MAFTHLEPNAVTTTELSSPRMRRSSLLKHFRDEKAGFPLSRIGANFGFISRSATDPAPPLIVIPVKAGIQPFQALAVQSLDPRFRGDDGKEGDAHRRNRFEQAKVSAYALSQG